MNIEEAISYVQETRRYLAEHEECDMEISALRAQQAPAKLDRSRWEGCCWCTGFCPEVTGDPHWDYRFCPYCGRPLTEEAEAELERRIGGNDGTTYS